MKHAIHESLVEFATPVDSLVPLDRNPRRGNVAAIVASYREFGQMKPIIVRRNSDGTATVIAGNHQLQAAKSLGWTHIAAVEMDVDEKRAIAFAIADNRTMELGHSDNTAVVDLLGGIIDDYGDLMGDLGWDDFEIAYYDEQLDNANTVDSKKPGFIAPVLIDAAIAAVDKLASFVQEDADTGERRIVADNNIDHRELAVAGSTLAVPGAAPKAVVQYTLVFDDAEQQRRWYDFIRWLRAEPAYDGLTTGQKVISFIDAHSAI